MARVSLSWFGVRSRLRSHSRLVQGSWRDRAAVIDTLDWEQFRKNRAKELVAARESGQQLDSTEIKVVIARFNLVANWCSSEVSVIFAQVKSKLKFVQIVLTRSLDERVALVNKFIRLAWVSLLDQLLCPKLIFIGLSRNATGSRTFKRSPRSYMVYSLRMWSV